MSKSILVIASYAGSRRGSPNVEALLEKQLESLKTLKHDLDHVVVVATQRANEGVLNKFPEVIYRDNVCGSYGSWEHAWNVYGDKYDWYYFLEDDYVFNLDHFDKKMQDLFEEDTGYVCSYYAGNHLAHPTITHHASISNGLVHRKALEKADFTEMHRFTDAYDNRLQTWWSWALELTGYKVKDIQKEYDSPFFTGSGILRFNNNPILIKPFQMTDDIETRFLSSNA